MLSEDGLAPSQGFTFPICTCEVGLARSFRRLLLYGPPTVCQVPC